MPTQRVAAPQEGVMISKERDVRYGFSGLMVVAAILTLVGVVFGFYSSNPQTKGPEFIGADILLEAILLPLAGSIITAVAQLAMLSGLILLTSWPRACSSLNTSSGMFDSRFNLLKPESCGQNEP